MNAAAVDDADPSDGGTGFEAGSATTRRDT